MGEESIVIQRDPVRDCEQYKGKIDFYYGLRQFFLSGAIFAVLGLLSVASLIANPEGTGRITLKSIAAVTCLYICYRYFRKAVISRRERMNAFMSGKLVKGTVVGHRRSFLSWHSGGEYVIAVQVTTEGGKILEKSVSSPSRRFHEQYSLQTEVDVLLDPSTGAMFIPAEVGISASFK